MVRFTTIAVLIACGSTTSSSSSAAAAFAPTPTVETVPHLRHRSEDASLSMVMRGKVNNVYDSVSFGAPHQSSTYRPLFGLEGRTRPQQQQPQRVRLSDAGKADASRSFPLRQQKQKKQEPQPAQPQRVRLSDVGKEEKDQDIVNNKQLESLLYNSNDDMRDKFTYIDEASSTINNKNKTSKKDVWGGRYKQGQQQPVTPREAMAMTDSSGGGDNGYYGRRSSPGGGPGGGGSGPRQPNLFEKVSNFMADSSAKTMLKADIAFLEREINARKQKFGIDVYDVMAQMEYEYEMFVQENSQGRNGGDERQRQEAIDGALERMEKDKEFRIRRLFEQARRDVDIYQTKMDRKEDEIMEIEAAEEQNAWEQDRRNDVSRPPMPPMPRQEQERRRQEEERQQQRVRLSDTGKEEYDRRDQQDRYGRDVRIQQDRYGRNVAPPPTRPEPPQQQPQQPQEQKRKSVRLSDLGKGENESRRFPKSGMEAPDYNQPQDRNRNVAAEAASPKRAATSGRIDDIYNNMAGRNDGPYGRPPAPQRGRLSDMGKNDWERNNEFDDRYDRDVGRGGSSSRRMRLSDMGKEDEPRRNQEFDGPYRGDDPRSQPGRESLRDVGGKGGEWGRNEVDDPYRRSALGEDFDSGNDARSTPGPVRLSDVGKKEDYMYEEDMANRNDYDRYGDPREARDAQNRRGFVGPSPTTSERIGDRYRNTLDQW